MTQPRPTKTELRQGRIPRLRRPKYMQEPVTARELEFLGSDPEEPGDTRSVSLHDSTDEPRRD